MHTGEWQTQSTGPAPRKALAFLLRCGRLYSHSDSATLCSLLSCRAAREQTGEMVWEGAFPASHRLDAIWDSSLFPAFLPLTLWCYPVPPVSGPSQAGISSPDRRQEGEKAAGQPLPREQGGLLTKGHMTGGAQEILIK